MAEETTEIAGTPSSGTETAKMRNAEIVDEAAEVNVIVEKKTATAEANEI